jgi:hypothetical protein
MNVIASLKHTNKRAEHITFWRPDHRGYTPILERAGHYDEAAAARLNDGLDCLAVPLEVARELTSPTPYYKPGFKFYDFEGPVVDNTRANWARLIAGSLPAGRETDKPKPEVYRGKRRSFATGGAA